MAKLKATIGVTVGIFDGEGRLLLRRRKEHDSITDKDYYGCWELPVVAVQETDANIIPYDDLSRELVRGVKVETGFTISVNPMPPFYPVMFKNDKGEYDVAMVTPMCVQLEKESTENEIIFVCPFDLYKLATEYVPVKKDKDGRVLQEGRGLVSGLGKRMYCMALKAFETGSSSRAYAKEARLMLIEAQKEWK